MSIGVTDSFRTQFVGSILALQLFSCCLVRKRALLRHNESPGTRTPTRAHTHTLDTMCRQASHLSGESSINEISECQEPASDLRPLTIVIYQNAAAKESLAQSTHMHSF